MIRRRFLTVTGALWMGAAAGCVSPVDFGQVKRLTAHRITVSQTDEGWSVDVVVVNHNTFSEPAGDFHDVTVLGFNGEQRVCSRHLGTVTRENDSIDTGHEVTMTCAERPTTITFEAAESPCDDDVVINVAVYSDSYDGWLVDRHHRKCNEGLPPQPGE